MASVILVGDLPFGNEVAHRVIEEDIGLAVFFDEVHGEVFLALAFHC